MIVDSAVDSAVYKNIPYHNCPRGLPVLIYSLQVLGSLIYYVTIPDSSNNSHLKIIRLPLYSNVDILPAYATRGHHCSPLLHVSDLILDLRSTVEQ